MPVKHQALNPKRHERLACCAPSQCQLLSAIISVIVRVLVIVLVVVIALMVIITTVRIFSVSNRYTNRTNTNNNHDNTANLHQRLYTSTSGLGQRVLPTARLWGFKSSGTLFGDPYTQDYNIWGSMVGSSLYGNYH